MPIELLDVAGLVPGAHEGKGLGNRFLDDLRHADALVHVVDVSGTTDAEGETVLQQLKLGRFNMCPMATSAYIYNAQGRSREDMTRHKILYGCAQKSFDG